MNSLAPTTIRRLFTATVLAGATYGLTSLLPVLAQDYPNKPITLVVPYSAGGSVDGIMRTLQPKFASELGQPLIIENVGGAGGALGAAKAANAPNDGYTLLVGSLNDVVLAPVLNKNVRYRPQDFSAIGPIGSSTPMLVARKDLPFKDLDAVIAALRAKPESLSYGSPGAGTMQHLVMEDLQSRAGVRLIHVPYKGAGPLVTDVIGGQVDLAVVTPFTVLTHIEAGRLKALGVASLQRLPGMKNIPTLNEGKIVKGLESNGWLGLFAPKGLAPERMARLKAALETALNSKGTAEQLLSIGMDVPAPAERRDFAEQVNRDEAKARRIGVKLQ